MPAEHLHQNEGVYALALQFGDYRGACRQAIRAIRRAGHTDIWVLRLRGSFARRNGRAAR